MLCVSVRSGRLVYGCSTDTHGFSKPGGVDLGHSVRWMGDQPAAGTLSGYPRVKASLCKKVPQRERTRLVSSAVQNKSPFHSLVSRS